jgi:hypothetical protein
MRECDFKMIANDIMQTAEAITVSPIQRLKVYPLDKLDNQNRQKSSTEYRLFKNKFLATKNYKVVNNVCVYDESYDAVSPLINILI